MSDFIVSKKFKVFREIRDDLVYYCKKKKIDDYIIYTIE